MSDKELARLMRPWNWFYGSLLALLAEMWVLYLTRVSMPWWCFVLLGVVTVAAGLAGGRTRRVRDLR